MDNKEQIKNNAIEAIEFAMQQFSAMYTGKYESTFNTQDKKDAHKSVFLSIFIENKMDLERCGKAIQYITKHMGNGIFEWPELPNVISAWKEIKVNNHGARKHFEDTQEVLKLDQLKDSHPTALLSRQARQASKEARAASLKGRPF